MDVDDQSAERLTRRRTPRPTRSNRWIVELVGVVLVAIIVAVLLRTFVVATYSIPSGSMEPTLRSGTGSWWTS